MNLKISLDLDVTQERRCGSRMSASNRFNNVHRARKRRHVPFILNQYPLSNEFTSYSSPPFSPHNVEKFFYHMQLLKTVFPLPSIEMKLSSFSFSRNKNEKKVMNLIGSSMYLVFSSIK